MMFLWTKRLMGVILNGREPKVLGLMVAEEVPVGDDGVPLIA